MIGIEHVDRALSLDSGARLPSFDIAYETWGTLSPARDNVVLVCHSLTKTAHAARGAPGDRPGWWDAAIGPGRMLDTDRWFVVCTDTLAAGGSTGPQHIDPHTGRRYGGRFPVVTVRDMVRAQQAVLAQWGVERLHCVLGGCFGGQQAVQWAVTFPDRVQRQVAIAVTPDTSAHSIAIFAVMRNLIRSDPAWRGGDYPPDTPPRDGLNRAIAAAVPLWMSREAMQSKFGRRGDAPGYTLDAEFEVEKFLQNMATRSSHGIDANNLLYLTRAVEYFDLGELRTALSGVTAQSLFISYRSDWRYPSQEVDRLHRELAGTGRRSQHRVVDNALGHGGFMLDVDDFAGDVTALLDRPEEVRHARAG